MNKPIIGFWAGENYFKFLEPIIEYLSIQDDLIVKKFEYYGDDKTLEKQLKGVDLAWFEWARGPVEKASFLLPKKPKICRLHKYEVYIDSIDKINWPGIKRLVFISPSVLDTFKTRHPDNLMITKTEVIRNGVDVNKFNSEINRKNQKKVVFNGRFHYHKSPELLLQIINNVLKKDNKFTFHMIGKFVDPVIEEYFWYEAKQMRVNKSITYYGEINNVEEWLRDKDIFLQPSIIEGQSVAALEAMACGLKPVLHNYYNSYKVFPKKFLFNTIEEAVDMVMARPLDRENYRNYVVNKNNLVKQNKKVYKLIKQVLSE